MDCKDIEGLIPAYALDALGPEEEALVEEHIDSCARCGPLYLERTAVALALASFPERYQPPLDLKRRVLMSVGKTEKEGRPRLPMLRFRPALLAAAASISLLLLAAVAAIGVNMSSKIDNLQEENSDLTGMVSHLGSMLEEQRSVNYLLASPEKQVVSLEKGPEQPRAQGLMMIAYQTGTVLVMARGLQPSSENLVYEVWLRRGDGERITVGHLTVDQTGWGTLTLWPDQPITLFQQIWITAAPAKEPERAQISATPVLWGKIDSTQ